MILSEAYKSLTVHINETSERVLDIHRRSVPPNRLLDACTYALSASGKMLRGVMLLQACCAVGGDPEDVMYAAAGTEYGHLASLVHDDLMDLDEQRRGQTTVWREYGSDTAVLTGDLFIFEVFHCLSLCRQRVPAERIVRVLEVISRACIELCLGQSQEIPLIGNCSANSAEYIEMVRNKTGSLFRAALASGAILGGGTEEQVAALDAYGDHLGIAFQIVDDLLCYTGQDQVMRKSTLSDIRNHRVTLPIQYALEAADGADHQVLREVFEYGLFDDDLFVAHDIVSAILERTGARARAERAALDHQRQAFECLKVLPENTGRDYLEMIAHLVVKREY